MPWWVVQSAVERFRGVFRKDVRGGNEEKSVTYKSEESVTHYRLESTMCATVELPNSR